MQKLCNASAGCYTVKWIFAEPEIRQILSNICIEVGVDITILKNNPLGGILLRSAAGSFYVDPELLAGITV